MPVLADDLATATDSELVLRCQRGDRHSFQILYRRYHKRVRSTLYQLCGASILDDLMQEVFLRVWKSLPTLRQASNFSTWLYRISWNVASDQRRKFARTKQEQLCLEDQESISRSISGQENTPDLMQLYYQDLVQQGLQVLKFDQRVVLVLHDLEDVPQKEVAKILGIPVGTVKSRLFHARASLRKFLQQQGEQL